MEQKVNAQNIQTNNNSIKAEQIEVKKDSEKQNIKEASTKQVMVNKDSIGKDIKTKITNSTNEKSIPSKVNEVNTNRNTIQPLSNQKQLVSSNFNRKQLKFQESYNQMNQLNQSNLNSKIDLMISSIQSPQLNQQQNPSTQANITPGIYQINTQKQQSQPIQQKPITNQPQINNRNLRLDLDNQRQLNQPNQNNQSNNNNVMKQPFRTNYLDQNNNQKNGIKHPNQIDSSNQTIQINQDTVGNQLHNLNQRNLINRPNQINQSNGVKPQNMPQEPSKNAQQTSLNQENISKQSNLFNFPNQKTNNQILQPNQTNQAHQLIQSYNIQQNQIGNPNIQLNQQRLMNNSPVNNQQTSIDHQHDSLNQSPIGSQPKTINQLIVNQLNQSPSDNQKIKSKFQNENNNIMIQQNQVKKIKQQNTQRSNINTQSQNKKDPNQSNQINTTNKELSFKPMTQLNNLKTQINQSNINNQQQPLKPQISSTNKTLLQVQKEKDINKHNSNVIDEITFKNERQIEPKNDALTKEHNKLISNRSNELNDLINNVNRIKENYDHLVNQNYEMNKKYISQSINPTTHQPKNQMQTNQQQMAAHKVNEDNDKINIISQMQNQNNSNQRNQDQKANKFESKNNNVSLITIPIQQPIKNLKPIMSPVIELDDQTEDNGNKLKQNAEKKEGNAIERLQDNQNRQDNYYKSLLQNSKSQSKLAISSNLNHKILLNNTIESNNSEIKLQISSKTNVIQTTTPIQQINKESKLQLIRPNQSRPISHYPQINQNQPNTIQINQLDSKLQNNNQQSQYFYSNQQRHISQSNDLMIQQNRNNTQKKNTLVQSQSTPQLQINQKSNEHNQHNEIKGYLSNSQDANNNQGITLNQLIQKPNIKLSSQLIQQPTNPPQLNTQMIKNNQFQLNFEGKKMSAKYSITPSNQKPDTQSLLNHQNMKNNNQMVKSQQINQPNIQKINNSDQQLLLRQIQDYTSTTMNRYQSNLRSNMISISPQRNNANLCLNSNNRQMLNKSLPNPNQIQLQNMNIESQIQPNQLNLQNKVQLITQQQTKPMHLSKINIDLRNQANTQSTLYIKNKLINHQLRLINTTNNNELQSQRYINIKTVKQNQEIIQKNQPKYIQVQARITLLSKQKDMPSTQAKQNSKPKPPELVRDNNDDMSLDQYKKEHCQSPQQKHQQEIQQHRQNNQQTQQQRKSNIRKKYAQLSFIKSSRLSFLFYQSPLKNNLTQMKNELKDLNTYVNLLTVENVTQRIQLENLSTAVNKQLDKMKINTIIRNIMKDNKNQSMTSRSVNRLLDIQEREIENTKSLMSILAKDKAKLNTFSSYPNIKLLKVQSNDYLSQIENLTIQIKELKHQKEEHFKCSKLLSELEKLLRYSQEELKQKYLVNEQLVDKINEIKLKILKANTYRQQKERIVKKIDIPINQPRENKSVDEIQIMSYPKAMAIFTEKENNALQEAFSNDKRNYNKLMKVVSILEASNKSMVIQHKLRIRGYEGQMNDLMKRKKNEMDKALDIENKKMKIVIQINNYKTDKRTYIKKINEFSLRIVSLDNEINEKDNEIKNMTEEIAALRREIRSSQSSTISGNALEEEKTNRK